MVQAWHKKSAEESLCPLQTLLGRDHAFVIVDAILCWNQGIGSAMIIDQLVAEPPEFLDIRIRRVCDGRQLLIGRGEVAIKVETSEAISMHPRDCGGLLWNARRVLANNRVREFG